jgi:hypothetical protein
MFSGGCAFAGSKYADLLQLHIQGQLEFESLHKASLPAKNVSFICYSKTDPNTPIDLTISYEEIKSGVPGLLVNHLETPDKELSEILSTSGYALTPARFADFSGLLLAGGPIMKFGVLEALDQKGSDYKMALGRHVESAYRVLSIFKVENDNHKDDGVQACEQKNAFDFLCIEAANI